jgi:hypothetical protein
MHAVVRAHRRGDGEQQRQQRDEESDAQRAHYELAKAPYGLISATDNLSRQRRCLKSGLLLKPCD